MSQTQGIALFDLALQFFLQPVDAPTATGNGEQQGKDHVAA